MSIAVDNNTKAGYYDSVDGKVHTGERMGLVWNTGPIEYWGAINFPGNQLDRVGNASTAAPAVIDGNGWYDCRGGGTATWWIWSIDNYPSYGTGKIIVTWTDFAGTSNITLTDYTGVTYLPGESSANRNVYSIAETGNGGLRVKQTDGYATDVKVFMESDEPGIIAGRYTSDQYISDLAGASWIRYMDFMYTPYEGVREYSEYKRLGRGERQYMKLESIAAISNESGIPPWVCLPPMGTDQCFVDMAAALNAALDPSTKIRVELGNEIWNTAQAYRNGHGWMDLFDAPLYESDSFDYTTGIITQAGHNIETGDHINTFRWGPNAGLSSPKYGGGFEVRGVKIDANNFKIVDDGNAGEQWYTTIGDISKGTTASVTQVGHPHVNDQVIHLYRMSSDGGVTGMTELEDVECTVKNVTTDAYDLWDKDGIAPIDSSLFGTFTQGRVIYHLYDTNYTSYDGWKKAPSAQDMVRYKIRSEATQWWGYWTGYRSAELWAIFDAEFGRDRVIGVLSGQTQNDSWMRTMLNAPGCRARYDLIATAPYFQLSNTNNGVTPIAGGWENAAIEELTDYIVDNDFPYEGKPNRLDGIKRMINDSAKCYRFVTYEGGDHTTTSRNTTKSAKHWDWTSSVVNGPSGLPPMQRCYEEYYKRLSELGVKDHGIYTMALATDQDSGGSVPWGTMKVTGDTDTPKYLAFKTFDDEGGVP